MTELAIAERWRPEPGAVQNIRYAEYGASGDPVMLMDSASI
ncbi:hypothetical protein ACIRRA_42505 [Nocardia sp. NPDC101769]